MQYIDNWTQLSNRIPKWSKIIFNGSVIKGNLKVGKPLLCLFFFRLNIDNLLKYRYAKIINILQYESIHTFNVLHLSSNSLILSLISSAAKCPSLIISPPCWLTLLMRGSCPANSACRAWCFFMRFCTPMRSRPAQISTQKSIQEVTTCTEINTRGHAFTDINTRGHNLHRNQYKRSWPAQKSTQISVQDNAQFN